MATLTKNAILVTVRDRAKRKKIWDHKGYKSQITNICLKIKKAALTNNAILVMVRDRAKQIYIWDHKGFRRQITNIFKNSKFYIKNSNGRLDQKCYHGNVKEI